MANVLFDPNCVDDSRRERIYAGDVIVISPNAGSSALRNLALSMIEDAFHPLDRQTAQDAMEVRTYADLLAQLKPKFIHHPDSKRHIRTLLIEAGCDPEHTYFDVPRMRTSTSDDYLTAGIAYAFHPHRDTWYSAPMCQINWWMPVFETEAANGMAFHPRYWSTAVNNSSAGYNYQRWIESGRKHASQQIGQDTREQPKPLEPIELASDLRVVPPVGGVMLFSAAQLHSSVPNFTRKTRFSIDFRTIHIRDAESLRGAPNIDSFCTGTTMPDYLRVADLAHVPDAVINAYMPSHPQPLVSRDAVGTC